MKVNLDSDCSMLFLLRIVWEAHVGGIYIRTTSFVQMAIDKRLEKGE
jgi:hypothetical protein